MKLLEKLAGRMKELLQLEGDLRQSIEDGTTPDRGAAIRRLREVKREGTETFEVWAYVYEHPDEAQEELLLRNAEAELERQREELGIEDRMVQVGDVAREIVIELQGRLRKDAPR